MVTVVVVWQSASGQSLVRPHKCCLFGRFDDDDNDDDDDYDDDDDPPGLLSNGSKLPWSPLLRFQIPLVFSLPVPSSPDLLSSGSRSPWSPFQIFLVCFFGSRLSWSFSVPDSPTLLVFFRSRLSWSAFPFQTLLVCFSHFPWHLRHSWSFSVYSGSFFWI
jgi:hypothetical protein